MNINTESYKTLKEKGLKRLQIAQEFGISESKLKKLISANGWASAKPIVSKPNLFSSFTEKSTYWAGFIAADGCIYKGTLKICLNYDDTKHLLKFKEDIGSTHSISSNTDKYYRSEISMKNETIEKDLHYIYNVTPQKSLSYRLPTQIPEEMFRHFLRGYFDGDGCICESFSNINSKTASLYATIAGSNCFVDELYLKLFKILNIEGSIQRKENHSIIKYNTNASLVLLNYMYENSNIFLDRKKTLYEKVISGNRKTR